MPPRTAAAGGGSTSHPLVPLVKKVGSSTTTLNAKLAGDNLARAVLKHGLAAFSDQKVVKSLSDYASGSKPSERMSSTTAFQSLIAVLGPSVLPFLLPIAPVLLNLFADDDEVIKTNATKAFQGIVSLAPVEAIQQIIEILAEELKTTPKWKCKVGCLKEISRLVDLKGQEGKEEIASMLALLLPIVEHSMHDTKKEVSPASLPTLSFGPDRAKSGLERSCQYCKRALLNPS